MTSQLKAQDSRLPAHGSRIAAPVPDGRRRCTLTRCALGLGLCVVLASGCAKARAETAPDGPPLEMPAPPPRVLAPVDQPLPATAAVPDPPVAEPRPPARPPVRRGTPAEAEARPEPPPAPAAAIAPPEPAPAETRELRAAPSNAATAERGVRDLLTRASRDLNRVDYGRLSADGRTQYEQSKRFSQQAEQALRDRNFVFAATLADKAATLATELLGGR
jgi:outer membrane biosynthesis protein TonB